MAKVKLENKGKGDSGKGVNHRIVALVPHQTLPICKVITFWAAASFEGVKEVELEDFVTILSNLEERENENGKFLVWNGK